jgi:hypothetical protein
MPTALRLLFLLMLGLFGLQPVSYGYDAPTAFVSGAQNIVAASLESQAATVGIAAPLPLSFNREGAASGILANIGQTSNFVAAETAAQPVALGLKATGLEDFAAARGATMATIAATIAPAMPGLGKKADRRVVGDYSRG